MKKIIIIAVVLLASIIANAQVTYKNMVGTFQSKDTTGGKNVRFNGSTIGIVPFVTTPVLKDSLSNYTPLQDGLISGGSATIGTGSVTIDTAYYRINRENKISLPRTFTGISNSASGTQYYILVYGKGDNTLDTLQGIQDTIAVIPTKPAGTVSINTVLVGDGGVVSSVSDFGAFFPLETAITGNANDKINVAGKGQPLSNAAGTIDGYAYGPFISFGTTGYVAQFNANYLTGKLSFRTSNDSAFSGWQEISTGGGGSGSGTVTSITAGTGLTGGTITTSGTIAVDTTVIRTVANSYSLASGQPRLVSGTNIKTINSTTLLGSGDIATESPLTFIPPLVRTTNTISINDATTSTKGIASFTASDFDVTSGNVVIDYVNGQKASASVSGFVSTAAQTLAGDKTFQDSTIVNKLRFKNLQGLGGGSLIVDNTGLPSVVPIADRLTTNVITKTANYTVTLSDVGANGEVLVRADATSGNITITLPVASTSTGLNFIVKKTDSSVNTVTVSVASTIDGASTKVYSTQYSGGRITSNGTSYSITGAF
jgi:hypothetical protein